MGTRYFALVVGIVYALVGLVGLLGLFLAPYNGPDLAVTAQQGRLLGLFPVNVLHNIVHLGIGVWGIAAYRSYGGARFFARALAVLYGLLAIMGFIPVLNTTFGLIPIHSHDIWLHALTAAVAAYFGFVAPAETGDYVGASRAR